MKWIYLFLFLFFHFYCPVSWGWWVERSYRDIHQPPSSFSAIQSFEMDIYVFANVMRSYHWFSLSLCVLMSTLLNSYEECVNKLHGLVLSFKCWLYRLSVKTNTHKKKRLKFNMICSKLKGSLEILWTNRTWLYSFECIFYTESKYGNENFNFVENYDHLRLLSLTSAWRELMFFICFTNMMMIFSLILFEFAKCLNDLVFWWFLESHVKYFVWPHLGMILNVIEFLFSNYKIIWWRSCYWFYINMCFNNYHVTWYWYRSFVSNKTPMVQCWLLIFI